MTYPSLSKKKSITLTKHVRYHMHITLFLTACSTLTKMSEVHNTDHDRTTMQAMYEHWKEKAFCDVTLACGDKKIEAHKIVLSSISGYFKNLFKYADAETKTCVIDQDVTHGDNLQAIIDYAYSGSIVIDGENAQDLLVAGSFLQIDFIVKESEKYMADNIDNTESDYAAELMKNIAELIKLSNRYNLRGLLDAICRFISNNFEEINNSSTFWELPPNDFCSLIKNKWMSVLVEGIPVNQPEAEILKLVGKYLSIASVSHEQFDKDTVSTLLKEIHFRDMTSDDIKSVIDVYPIIECDIVKDALSDLQMSREDNMKKSEADDTISEKEPRIYSNRIKKLFSSIKYADGGQVSDITETFMEKWPDIETDLNLRIKRIRIFIRRWDGRPVVGGMAVEYNSGRVVQYGGRPSEDKLVSDHDISLDENEVITKVGLRCGWMIDNLEFFTNLGRTFGPFGGLGGLERTAAPHRAEGYLHSFDGKEVFTRGELGITCLSFRWVAYYRGSVELLEKAASLKSRNDSYDRLFLMASDNSDIDSESDVSDFSY